MECGGKRKLGQTMSAARAISLLALALCVVAVSAGEFNEDEVRSTDRYQIQGDVKFPPAAKSDVLIGTRITLNGNEFEAIPRADGSFVFANVPVGSYLLEVSCTSFLFETLRIDVSDRDGGKIKVVPLNRRERMPYPLQLRPVVEAQYFQPRDGVNFGSLLSNPMGIFLVIGVFFMVVMPKLVGNLDPAELAEMQKHQAAMNPANLMAGLQKKLDSAAGTKAQ